MKPLSHERRILLMAVTAGLPGSLVALIFLWTGDFTPKVQWTLTVLIVGLWSGFRAGRSAARGLPAADGFEPARGAARGRLLHSRAAGRSGDALGEVMTEVNALGETLRNSAWARSKRPRCCAP